MPSDQTPLVVGFGLQGRATVYDLLRHSSLRVVVADGDPQSAASQLDALKLRPQAPEIVDASDAAAVAALIRRQW